MNCITLYGQMLTAMHLSFCDHRKRIRLLPILASVLMFILGSAHVEAQNAQAIEVTDSGYLFGTNFYRVYLINDYIVYQSRIHYTSSKTIASIDSVTKETVYEDSLVSSGWKNRYFVFHRDSSFGYQYGPDKLYITPRLPITEIKKQVAGGNAFEALLATKPDSVVRSSDSAELREVYLSPAKPDTPALRAVFSYSAKLNPLNYSLNPILDSVKKRKLWKFEFFVAGFHHKRSNTTYPAYYVGTVMREFPGPIPPEVLFYLNWYKEVVQWTNKNSNARNH